MMRKDNRQEISRLQHEGYGPTAIARKLGLPVSTVKGYTYTHITQREGRCCYCGKIIRIPKRKTPEFIFCNYCRQRYGWG